jgi:IclR family transcriptional regulator, KDG regulon repressor
MATSKGTTEGRTAGIQSLARASAILEEIVRHRDGISLARLSELVGLHSSTAFHLVKSLAVLGYVRQDDETKLYRVGPLVFRLAASAFDDVELLGLGRPYLEELAMRTSETTHLAVQSGSEIVIIGRSEGTGAFRMAEHTGSARPAHATAVGKILLAAMPEKNLELFLQKHELVPLTARTITDPEILRADLERIRRTGVSYDEGEFHPEIRCVAAGIRDFTRNTVAAIGISTPVWRLSMNEVQDKTDMLRSVAMRLSRDLGCPGTEEADGADEGSAPVDEGDATEGGLRKADAADA